MYLSDVIMSLLYYNFGSTLYLLFVHNPDGHSKLKDGLPEECQIACSCAISQLEEVSRQLQKGAVTILDIQKMIQKEEQMKRLCESARSQQKKTDESVEITYEALISTVDQRMQELRSFKEQQGTLLHLCQSIHHEIKGNLYLVMIYVMIYINDLLDCLPGVSEAKAELQENYDSYRINTLCTRSGNKIHVICFQSVSSLQPFANQFYILTQRCNSAIFNTIWSETMTCAHRSNPNMTISDVGLKVWEPAFTQCQQLLKQLQSGAMVLSNVDKHFSQYKGELKRLKGDLESLFHGVNACNEGDTDSSWIHQVVTRMMEYWRLCEYREAANSFLKLRDSLELTKGDFKNVEKISKEVKRNIYIYI